MRPQKLRLQIGRWILVGGTSVSLDWAIFALVYLASNSILLSNTISIFLSSTFNFACHKRWTFQDNGKFSDRTARYILNQFVNYLVSTVLIKTLSLSGVNPILLKPIVISIVAPVNFLSLKYFVFALKKVATVNHHVERKY
jgi:putative flippase GtrA